MICLSVYVNGERLYAAGVVPSGRVQVGIECTLRSQDDPALVSNIPANRMVLLAMAHSYSSDELLTWPHRSLAVGDEVMIRVEDIPEADSPAKREAKGPNMIEQAERELYEQLKRRFQ